MPTAEYPELKFERHSITAEFIDPSGQKVEKRIEIRAHPITGRTCRIAFSRINEKEAGTASLPQPPPDADRTSDCPFCRPQVNSKTPQLLHDLSGDGRMHQGDSLLFPNLFPYGSYSAVSLFDDQHFVEIGTATVSSYADGFINSAAYLKKVLQHDPQATYLAITQNHLPSAGGSLVHPHLQINADRIAGNHHRFLLQKTGEFYRQSGQYLFSRYLDREKHEGSRYIGATGPWEWMAAFRICLKALSIPSTFIAVLIATATIWACCCKKTRTAAWNCASSSSCVPITRPGCAATLPVMKSCWATWPPSPPPNKPPNWHAHFFPPPDSNIVKPSDGLSKLTKLASGPQLLFDNKASP
jgi:hypothetical protein